MTRVVFDMDPGIDDAVALLLALNDPQLEIAAITIVSGNVDVQKGTANALRLLDVMGRDIPVFSGAERPASGGEPVRAESVHGRDGLGNSSLAESRRRVEGTAAVDGLTELLNSSKKREVKLVATGPLTNVAELVAREPSLANRLDMIYVMGGLYDPSVKGNVTEYAEFNFFSDPVSADRVMRNDGSPVTAAGLELTSHPACVVDAKALAMIQAVGSKASKIAVRILNWPVATYSYFNLHDVFALFALVHPEIFSYYGCGVSVAHAGNYRGRCVVKPGDRNVKVCKTVNAARFNQLVIDGLRPA